MATAAKQIAPPTSRDSDFYTWALETASLIRGGRFRTIDWEAVAEEIEDMGRSERRALEIRIEVLLAHLIKWRFQPDQRSTSRTGTIKEQRRKAVRLLRQNPSLRPLLGEVLDDAYDAARAMAERDTGRDESTFPESCPWGIDDVLDQAFWPQSE